ncbi:MAG: indolepyruvate ferredoxin oxidoreductase family protein [Alphaproteobacteria bacterium]|nr:indolepyruvate ferredoxin oxidoreductase family protein [Alphaproteobacteria bacterium]
MDPDGLTEDAADRGAAPALLNVSLDDKYTLRSGRVFITGTQALVRLPLMQRERDAAAGLNTGGYISGYRGSPLGAYDQQLWRARAHLKSHNIHFHPGLNEDLALTAIWGTQQNEFFGDSTVDGVFGVWYAKGPGVDRSGDVLRHANFAGASKHGGVLLLAGDDHTCKSSTTAHQTEYAFMDAMVPVLNPAGVQEFLDLGLHGFAMSRYSGCYVAFKTVAETVDTSASVHVDPHRVSIALPDETEFQPPEGGLNIDYPKEALEALAQEERLHKHKLYAALAYAKKNKLDRTVLAAPKKRLGIVTAGKSYLDVMQALDDLGIDRKTAEAIGLSVYKVAMTWPLEPDGARDFCSGHEEILVVEEKRALIENQLKEQLYNWDSDSRPRIHGKFNEDRDLILPSYGELTPARIARAIAQRLQRLPGGGAVEEMARFTNRLAFLDEKEKQIAAQKTSVSRIPYFCSGCPHNTSTRVPDGSRAYAGIGCHFMAQWMDRETVTFTQMGGEGATWMGQAPFSKTKHIFANLGDGTYQHSGVLAIRAAVAAGVTLTYKILYNDAVAMTGGQPHEGGQSVASVVAQVAAEGAARVVVVSDEPEKYSGREFPHGVTVHHRDDLDPVQKELREIEGVTVMVYDQTCAAEKRRRRKRGAFPDPAKRAFINSAVCEGCGDCSVQSNCLSVTPKETDFGRKRRIDQSSCNKDYSCVKGFCPSFVTVHGGQVRKGAGVAAGPKPQQAAGADHSDLFEALPDPVPPNTTQGPYGILLTGVGGTGVVTVGAVLGMAAHLEGKGVSVLDMAGLAQKGGPVMSHIRIAETPEDIHAVGIAAGGADLLLGCDMVVASGPKALSKVDRESTAAVINVEKSITGDFTSNPDWRFPTAEMQELIKEAAGPDKSHFVRGARLATALLGDSIASNMFMLGYAWQLGLVPVTQDALDRAMELNGVAVAMNRQAFLWGRRAAHDSDAVEKVIGRKKSEAAEEINAVEEPNPATQSLEMLVEKRIGHLKSYQNEAYARRYKDFVVAVQARESSIVQDDSLARAVARYYFKLLAYKDEYEVARLYTDDAFLKSLNEQFEGDFTLRFHLAPPLFAKRHPDTGQLIKQEYGPWMMKAFALLAKGKFLRGTAFDPFGWTEERKMERQLIADYEATLETLLDGLNRDNHAIAVQIAEIPEHIRGFGHVKERHLADAKANEAALLMQFNTPPSPEAKQAAE